MSGNTPTSSSHLLARIAGAPLPPRVRGLLEQLHALAVEVLEQPLTLTMASLDRELFLQAEKARSSQLQSEAYAQMRQLRLHSNRFPALFFDGLEQQLAAFTDIAPRAAGQSNDTALKTMTLVEDTDIDRDIVLHEIARRESSRATIPLQLLGQRFGVLGAQPALEVEHLPLGPYALCRIVRDCGEQLQLDLAAQLQLYQAFERQVMERHTELVDRANILLAHEGVLPGLAYRPYLVRPSAPRGRSQAAPPPADAPANASRTGAAAGNRPLTGWQGQMPAASWTRLPGMAEDTVAGGSAPPPAGTATGPAPVTATAMAALHSLLGAARHAQMPGIAAAANGQAGAPAPSTAAPPAQPVPSQAVMEALGQLQMQAATPGFRRSFGDLHAALLERIKAEHGPTASFTPQDADTLDLLGMLYAQIQREVRSEGAAAELLARLQVPVARAAIHDESFFIRDQHPARELLNAVAESGATWLSDDEGDPVLLKKLGEAVNQVVTGYDGDETVFAEANRRIQAHLRAAARKAEVAERRHVEAARGKERLQAARQLAGTTIEQLCAASSPPKFVQTLLRQAWADVLTLALLRQGEESAQWQQLQATTTRIGETTCAPAGGPADTVLGNQVQASLLQVGYHQDEAAAIARRLSTPGGADDITSRTELTARLKARARLGEDSGPQEEAPAGHPPPPERSGAEEACYRQLRTLPFGTWLEFVTNQQGDSQRKRLSWYSLITDNALFVNQRGQKVAEYSLDALARLMARKQLRIVTEDHGRLIDRAWQATLRTLRSLAGSKNADPEST